MAEYNCPTPMNYEGVTLNNSLGENVHYLYNDIISFSQKYAQGWEDAWVSKALTLSWDSLELMRNQKC